MTLSQMAFIWASFAIMMFGSAIFFLDWRFTSKDSNLKRQTNKNEGLVEWFENLLKIKQ